MYNPLSAEDQKNLIEKAIHNNDMLKVIEAANVYSEDDRSVYIHILKSTDVERAFNIYSIMDTAAREEFINLIREG